MLYRESNGVMIVNDDLGGMWKEKVMVCFKVLSHHLPTGNEENNEKPYL
jgi:hypothetical protein